jgi:glutamyl endopeptidase
VKRIRVHLIRTLGVIAALAAVAVSSLPAASADAASPAAPSQAVSRAGTVITAPMTIVRVARLVTSTPDKAGRVEVQLDNGAIIAIPAADENLVMRRAAQDAKAEQPNGIVHGNCGSSWIYLYDKADAHPVRIVTGFHVNTGAVAYSWQAAITGPQRTDIDYVARGTLALRTMWEDNASTPLDYPQGDYSAAVSKSSYAVLWTGSVCHSGGPTAKEFLTSPDAPVDWRLSTGAASSASGMADTAGMATPSAILSSTGSRGRVSLARVIGMSPNSVIGKDTRKRVENTTAYPYTAIAMLIVSFRGGRTQLCTGFFIAADTVATAGHCLYQRSLGRATKVLVIPGNNVNERPFGSCLGAWAYSVTGWMNDRNSLYDYAAIKLNCDTGVTVGWFGMLATSSSLTRTSVTITGYPGDKKPTGSMWTASGKISSSAERQVFYTISTGGGQSGAPVYKRGCGAYCALAIHASGTGGSHPHTNAGTRITQAAFDNLVAWAS